MEVIRIPSCLFGAAPPNAKIPPNVLNEVNPLAVPLTSMPFLLLPEITLPSGITPPTCVFCGRARDQQAVAAIGHDRGVVGPDAHEIGLDRRVVGIGDPQAVAAVAAEHVVKHKRALAGTCSRSVDCRWRLTMATPSCRLPSAELPEAVVPTKLPLKSVWVAPLLMSTPSPRLPEIRLPWGGRTNTFAGGIVAAGRLAADDVPGRAIGDEDAVLGVAAFERAAGVRADVIHGDLIAAGTVDPDAVAAVAADHVGELEADVDRRLVRKDARAGNARSRRPGCPPRHRQ